MILQELIGRYKRLKSNAILKEAAGHYKYNYAVVGMGVHSLATYYPLLSFLGVPVKYVVTKRQRSWESMKSLLPHATFTTQLNEVLKDATVKGIIVCTPPHSLMPLTEQCLKAGRHVLAEKPLCDSLAAYEKIKALSKYNCMLALQRRYNNINKTLTSKKLNSKCCYEARFNVGAYPEGNELYEVFIHALDNLIFLMGPATMHALQFKRIRGGRIIQLQLQHNSGGVGMVTLSTAHHWRSPVDHLIMETPYEQISIDYSTNRVDVLQLGGWKSKMALEKIFSTPPIHQTLYQGQHISLGFHNNSLVESGFYGLVNEFLNRTEGINTPGQAPSDIQLLQPTFELLHELSARLQHQD